MAKHLYVANQYGTVQLTDEASSYFFLKEIVPLSKYYWSTSDKCECTWNDGTVTTAAYNYCVNHAIDAKLVFVLKNESTTPVRLAVAPLDFIGNPSFHVSVTGCTKEIADNLKVYIFSGDVSEFTDPKAGMAFYDASGKALYNSNWKPLKIIGHKASDAAMNEGVSFGATCGAILNSGYRNASDSTITTGVWTTSISSSTGEASSYVYDNSGWYGHSTGHIIGGTSGTSTYKSCGQAINTFPTSITYQGYILSNTSLTAQTYTAKAPIASATTKDTSTSTSQEYTPVQRWDDCAWTSSRWDSCAYTKLEWDSCASTDFFTGECKSGLVNKCYADFVTVCNAGYKTDWEWVTVTTTTTTTTTVVSPYMDNISLMYGMEAYPDGTIFTRSSGTSTIGVVDLTNYS